MVARLPRATDLLDSGTDLQYRTTESWEEKSRDN